MQLIVCIFQFILVSISILKSMIIMQVSNLLVRCQSTVTMADHGSTQIKQKAKTLSEMPSPPAWPIIRQIPLVMKKENKILTDKTFERMTEDHGEIYRRMCVPGQGTMVVLFRPENDMFQFIKNTSMKDRYPNTGLLTNTEDWYNVRRMVQHDMLRPKTALSHVSEIEEIAMELKYKNNKLKDKDGTLDMTELVQEYALEAVGSVFLGTRLGTMKEGSYGKLLIGYQAKTLKIAISLFFLPTSIAPYRFVKYQGLAFDICKKHVDEAIAKVKKTDETVIARFVRKCGNDSTITMLVGVDALQAGRTGWTRSRIGTRTWTLTWFGTSSVI
eukprot:GFUD01050401.1.p1 GENE.GFUD01050401.1~~GFUD01050401.1.p1  ORF type:complete len:329 (+),score=52.84 GFUD01050401.1:1-987(+)